MSTSVRVVSSLLAVMLLVASLGLLAEPAVGQDTGSAGIDRAAIAALAPPEVPGADEAMVDSVTRLYLAVFDRLPDPDGHRYWVAQRAAGMPSSGVADAFIASTEWSARYGTVDDGHFVDLLYHNVLGRAPDEAGTRYWRSVIDRGTARRQLLLHFSNSDEFVLRTGTAEPPPPYPSVPAASGTGRRVVYANTAQRVWLIDADGSVHDSYAVSGRRDTPRPGTYSVFSKSPKAWAGHGGITMNHMVRFARGRSLAIGFHSIPVRPGGIPLQSIAALGSYQSAGCVRQSEHKARLLFDWAALGTTVVVLD